MRNIELISYTQQKLIRCVGEEFFRVYPFAIYSRRSFFCIDSKGREIGIDIRTSYVLGVLFQLDLIN